jgi:uncharacterized protein YjbI with pentapeptide repeats
VPPSARATTGGFGLYGANLTGADLGPSIISGSEALHKTNLTNTNLRRAVITGNLALFGATDSNTTCPDGQSLGGDRNAAPTSSPAERLTFGRDRSSMS